VLDCGSELKGLATEMVKMLRGGGSAGERQLCLNPKSEKP